MNSKGCRTPKGEAFRNAGDHVGLAEHVSNGNEVREAQTYAPSDPGVIEHRVHSITPGARGNHNNVVGVGEFLQCHSALVERVAFAKHADVAMTEQAALEDASLQIGDLSKRKIDTAGLHVFFRFAIAFRTVLIDTSGAMRASSSMRGGRK